MLHLPMLNLWCWVPSLHTTCFAVRLSVCRQTHLPSVGLRELQGQAGDLHTAQLVFQTGLRVPSGMRPLRVDQHWTGYPFLPVVRKAVCVFLLAVLNGRREPPKMGPVFVEGSGAFQQCQQPDCWIIRSLSPNTSVRLLCTEYTLRRI